MLTRIFLSTTLGDDIERIMRILYKSIEKKPNHLKFLIISKAFFCKVRLTRTIC